jgi:hypothetical protein
MLGGELAVLQAPLIDHLFPGLELFASLAATTEGPKTLRPSGPFI